MKKLNLKPILSGEKQELQMLRLEIEGLLTLFPPGCLACLLQFRGNIFAFCHCSGLPGQPVFLFLLVAYQIWKQFGSWVKTIDEMPHFQSEGRIKGKGCNPWAWTTKLSQGKWDILMVPNQFVMVCQSISLTCFSLQSGRQPASTNDEMR